MSDADRLRDSIDFIDKYGFGPLDSVPRSDALRTLYEAGKKWLERRHSDELSTRIVSILVHGLSARPPDWEARDLADRILALIDGEGDDDE